MGQRPPRAFASRAEKEKATFDGSTRQHPREFAERVGAGRARGRPARRERARGGYVPRCPQLFSRVLTNTSVAWSSSTSSTCSLCSLEGLVSAETVDALLVFALASAGPAAGATGAGAATARAVIASGRSRASRRENAA